MKEDASGVVEEQFGDSRGLGWVFGEKQSDLLELEGRKGKEDFVNEKKDEDLNFKRA